MSMPGWKSLVKVPTLYDTILKAKWDCSALEIKALKLTGACFCPFNSVFATKQSKNMLLLWTLVHSDSLASRHNLFSFLYNFFFSGSRSTTLILTHYAIERQFANTYWLYVICNRKNINVNLGKKYI